MHEEDHISATCIVHTTSTVLKTLIHKHAQISTDSVTLQTSVICICFAMLGRLLGHLLCRLD